MKTRQMWAISGGRSSLFLSPLQLKYKKEDEGNSRFAGQLSSKATTRSDSKDPHPLPPTHTHTHTHTLSLSPSLPPPLSLLLLSLSTSPLPSFSFSVGKVAVMSLRGCGEGVKLTTVGEGVSP